MNLLQYFDKDEKDGLIIYRLKDDMLGDFSKEIVTDFRISYITDDSLESLAGGRKISKSEFLRQYILPDDAKIVSGDFGEIFCHFIVIENYRNKKLSFIGPLKWQWKDNRNKACQYTDSILFNIAKPPQYSVDDQVVTIESKMKAVASSAHRIQDAVDGANDDMIGKKGKLSRMIKTLKWLEEKYTRLNDQEKRAIAERFANPDEHGTYQKTHKAIAVIDSQFEADELSKPRKKTENIKILLFCMKDLKKIYEQTRVNLIKSVP